MHIYFLRHGQTDWNLLGKMQGHADIPLNETGMKQAQKTAEKFKDIKMDAIYSSPLTRAMETARIINQNWGLPIQTDERLQERNFGDYEGNASAALDYRELWKLSDEPPFHGAEDTQAFYGRVNDFLNSIGDIACVENILIVAHGGVSIPFHCYFHGYDLENYASVLLGNCEIACEEYKKREYDIRG